LKAAAAKAAAEIRIFFEAFLIALREWAHTGNAIEEIRRIRAGRTERLRVER
jgi:hypothetical protein